MGRVASHDFLNWNYDGHLSVVLIKQSYVKIINYMPLQGQNKKYFQFDKNLVLCYVQI